MNRVVLIGSIVIDMIKTLDGKTYMSPGGITYTLVALAKLLPEFEIVPVSWVGEGDLKYFENLAKIFPNVSLKGIKITEKSNHNMLEYISPEERIEFFKPNTPGIKFEDAYPFLNTSGVYINYIKNDDFPPQDLRSLSSYFRDGPIYIDIHSLVRKVYADGEFKPYYYTGWQSLAQYADYMQMNREEVKFFTGFEAKNLENLKNLVAMILLAGPKGVSVTMGGDGALAGSKKDSHVVIKKFSPPEVAVKDPTGCGDTFGAAVFSRILKGYDYLDAVKYAVKVASIKAALTLEEFVNYPIN